MKIKHCEDLKHSSFPQQTSWFCLLNLSEIYGGPCQGMLGLWTIRLLDEVECETRVVERNDSQTLTSWVLMRPSWMHPCSVEGPLGILMASVIR